MTLTTRSFLWIGLLVALLGWASAGIVVFFVPPSGPTVVLLLELLFFGVLGIALTVLALIYRLRNQDKPGRVLREGVLIAFFVVCLLALQYFELLSPEIGAAIALVFILFEGLMVYRERPPKPASPEAATSAPSRPRGRKRSSANKTG